MCLLSIVTREPRRKFIHPEKVSCRDSPSRDSSRGIDATRKSLRERTPKPPTGSWRRLIFVERSSRESCLSKYIRGRAFTSITQYIHMRLATERKRDGGCEMERGRAGRGKGSRDTWSCVRASAWTWGKIPSEERERDERRKERRETRERAKAREIGKRGHWLFVARSTYGNRYGPTIAVGMRPFFPFCVSPIYLANRSRSVAAAVVANLLRAIRSASDRLGWEGACSPSRRRVEFDSKKEGERERWDEQCKQTRKREPRRKDGRHAGRRDRSTAARRGERSMRREIGLTGRWGCKSESTRTKRDSRQKEK